MPDNAPPAVDPTDKDAIAAANAAAIEKQKQSDISGQSTAAENSPHTGTALDALRDKAIKDKKAAAEDTDLEIEPKPGDATPAAAAPAPEAGKDKPAAAAPAAAAPPAAPAPDPAAEALKKTAEEVFKDAPVLPPNASTKSRDAFQGIKDRAATEINTLRTKLAEATTKLAETEKKVKDAKPLSPELEQEIATLREFRAKLDVEADPQFKVFDKAVTDATDFIYAQLKRSPKVTAETLKKIQDMGGPTEVDMTKLLTSIGDNQITRMVEQKLVEIETAKYNKESALTKVKSNITEYQKQQAEAAQKGATAHNDATKQFLAEYSSKVPWLQKKEVDAKADEATRKLVEAENAFADKINQEMQLALTDDSPEMRATMVLGMGQLFRLQNVVEATKAENTKLKADLAEANTKIEALKKGASSRLRDSAAPPAGEVKPPKPPESAQFTETASAALDRMRAEKLKQAQQT